MKLTTYSDAVMDDSWGGNFSIDGDTTTGLTLGLTDGFVVNGGEVTTVVAGTHSLTANSTHWVYLTGAGPSIGIDDPQAGGVLYKIVTDGSGITSVDDYRGAFATNKTTL